MRVIYFEQEKDEWNRFVAENAADGGLFQSWQWGELAKNENKKIWRLALKNKDKILAVGLAIKENLPLKKSCLYLPRGLVIEKSILNAEIIRQILEILNYFLEELKKIGVRENAMAIRFDLPFLQGEIIKKDNLSKLGLRKSYKDIQPRTTLILDIARSEDELLNQMKPKTRYNLKLAAKKNLGVKIVSSLSGEEEKKNFSYFYQLLLETSRRDKFFLHPKEHYQKLLESALAKLFLAYYEGKVVGGIMVGFFGKTAVYLHGASSFEKRNLMAPYFLQWQAIKFAKSANFLNYDFGGIKSEKISSRSQENWAGLTRFKNGFVPNIAPTEFLGLWEYNLRPLTYFVYRILSGLVRRIRDLLRGL